MKSTWLLAATLACMAASAFAADIRALFSPWDDAEGAIIASIGQARQEVRVQAYLLTSRAITRALLAAQRRRVAVEVLADAEQARRFGGEALLQLSEAGVPVWIETRYAAAHNKVILIDTATAAPTVITGSYNFTWSAQARNAENVLIISGHPELAQRYRANWERHRKDATSWSQWRRETQESRHDR